MLTHLHKTPFPWFGGKSDAAEHVWAALGDVPHYVEPFAGSLAVLLRRPHEPNRTYVSETVNDLDGLLINVWRSIAYHPDATAEAASWPVSEVCLSARQVALVKWRESGALDRMAADPRFCDPEMAGWWLWGQSSWIGSGWCGSGPWWPDDSGRLVKRKGGGVSRQLPFVVAEVRSLARDARFARPGVVYALAVVAKGQGVNTAAVREPGVCDDHDFRPVTMPELRRWMAWLSARLRHVRFVHGDWSRVLTRSASKTLSVNANEPCGVFLDPPYADTAERADVYTFDSHSVAHDVRKWAIEHGDDPCYRIVLAGFEGEHEMPDSWRCVPWFKGGFLKGGMGNTGADGHQQARERLWLSPACLGRETAQQSLFA